MTRFYMAIFLVSLLRNSVQRSTPQDDSYVAAVLEYEVQSDIDVNVKNYVQFIQDAASQNADVVVFPEMTITRGTRAIPVPFYGILKQYPVPALNAILYDEILVAISAAARQHEIYVVINIQEQMDCASAVGEYCPEERLYLFNTNVVFDRSGAVIDRYRKINLYGEVTRFHALQPDLGIFKTDFGVTFGHFICFDLMFQVPSTQVVQKYNLTDILYPTMWFSEMPYATAVQVQEAYAYTRDVNFLAAGANNVGMGPAGSGIYSGKAGALISIIPGLPTTRLLVSRVPKVPGKVTFETPGHIYDNHSDPDNLVLNSDTSLHSHISRPLVQGFQEFVLADKEVSCRFRVRLNQREGEVTHQYRAFIQDSSFTHVRREAAVVACSVVACKNDTAESCPYRFSYEDKSVEIQELEIEMTTYKAQYNNTLKCDDIVYYPISLRNNKFPLSTKNFTYIDSTRNGDGGLKQTENGGREHVLLKLNTPQKELVSFAIWGRVYNKDVNHIKEITEEDIQNYINLENHLYNLI